MMKERAASRYRLTLEYIGTSFHGSQRQVGRRTVQAELESALAKLLPRQSPPPVAVFAGRTDAGVHALGNVVHTDLVRADKSGRTQLPFGEAALLGALNYFLGERIGVVGVRRVPPSFHARHSAVRRTYVYQLRCLCTLTAPSAAGVLRSESCQSLLRRGWVSSLDAHRVLCVPHPLDVDAMRAAAHLLLGVHNFSAFRSVRCSANSPMRELLKLEVIEEPRSALDEFVDECPRRLSICVCSRSFLHNQVRFLVATVLEVGLGRRDLSWVETLLQASDLRHSPQ
uniref:tRNA pseudouridine synthase n=1 Tax=Calcidiscus leptoporus TaxID=127549 RepID=A0A7S0JAS7_9EUKA